MIPRPLDRTGICVCGLGVALHFDGQNRKLTCDETRAWLQRCDSGDARDLIPISPFELALSRSC